MSIHNYFFGPPKKGWPTFDEEGNMLKTSEEWQQEFIDKLLVVDPDGWDRDNFYWSWHQELISEEEWWRRVNESTIEWYADNNQT